MTKSKTSSYLDLSPLYGSNQEMQDTIRTFKDGKLKADCFADKRLLGMPPGVGVLLIMFNRVHNDVCDNLIAINEDKKFTPPSPALEGERAAAAWKKYDNDLFQTARLVTSGLYINITLLDYVRNIVNVSPSPFFLFITQLLTRIAEPCRHHLDPRPPPKYRHRRRNQRRCRARDRQCCIGRVQSLLPLAQLYLGKRRQVD